MYNKFQTVFDTKTVIVRYLCHLGLFSPLILEWSYEESQWIFFSSSPSQEMRWVVIVRSEMAEDGRLWRVFTGRDRIGAAWCEQWFGWRWIELLNSNASRERCREDNVIWMFAMSVWVRNEIWPVEPWHALPMIFLFSTSSGFKAFIAAFLKSVLIVVTGA